MNSEIGVFDSTDGPDVFSYTDFRVFIRDVVESRKKKNPYYSYNSFARKMGVSRTFVLYVVKNQRKLPPDLVTQLMDALKLLPNERDYFQTLVRWNQESEPTAKDAYWVELTRLKPKDYLHELSGSEHLYLQHWFIFGLLSLIESKSFRLDLDWIRSCFFSRVEIEEIRAALRRLQRDGVIRIEGDTVKLVNPSILVARKSPRELIQKFHRENILSSEMAVTAINPEYRDISSSAFPMRHEDLQKVRQKIAEVREYVMELSQKAGMDADTAYQLNIQYFPWEGGQLEKDKI